LNTPRRHEDLEKRCLSEEHVVLVTVLEKPTPSVGGFSEVLVLSSILLSVGSVTR
jgi:hypothetical protein